MPQKVMLYNLLISCPGDVENEISLINEVVQQFNSSFSDALGITVQTKHWSKNAYPESGGKPQALLNEQIVNKCDAAIAIFWTRFGSPTDKYGSGTEEEIELMLETDRQIFMYFSDKPIPPSKQDADGYNKIKSFKEKYKDRGIYFTYSSDEEFKKLFFAHLTQYFVGKKNIDERVEEDCSELKLLGIDEQGKLSEDVPIQKFVLNAEMTRQLYVDNILTMYNEISSINVGKRTSNTYAPSFSFNTPLDIEQDEKGLLMNVAKQLKLELVDTFFDLGNLCKNSISSVTLYGGPSLVGTADEQKKYWLIKKLHDTISKALEWAPIEDAFSNKKCLKIALQNAGRAIDEDIEITLTIPREVLTTLNEFPQFNNDEMGYLLNDCDMGVLFGIKGTAEYIEYSESKQNRPYKGRTPYGLPGYVPDYSDDFLEELNDVFCYCVYSSEDEYIVKLKVDYIKHNSTVAFPSVLFVKEDILEIPYKITSKYNPDVFERILKVK